MDAWILQSLDTPTESYFAGLSVRPQSELLSLQAFTMVILPR